MWASLPAAIRTWRGPTWQASAGPPAPCPPCPRLEFKGGPLLLLKRFGFRWLYVLGTAGVAVCLPFVGELMGLVGAPLAGGPCPATDRSGLHLIDTLPSCLPFHPTPPVTLLL